MPTARPSISASVGALLDTVVSDETTTTENRVTATPISDDTIGIPAGSRAPNVMARIRKDTSRPRSSGTLLGSAVVL